VTPPAGVPIVQCGDPVLRRRAQPVDPSVIASPDFETLIETMRATMEQAPGVGLAAPQIGVPLQVAVMADGPDLWGRMEEEERSAKEREALPFTVLVNPALEAVGSRQASFFEGCLSVGGLTGVVTRHREVRVRALDGQGRPLDRTYTGWPARIVQHELDHLAGRLYLDRVEIRSLSTVDNYGRYWAGRSPHQMGEEMGFSLGD
jgi:peptide deformylase